MRYDKIDTVKSKVKGRLVRKTWLIEPILDLFFYAALIGFYPIGSGFYFFDQLKSHENLSFATILFLTALVFFGLMLYSVLTLDRLLKFQGTLKDQNREFIREVAEQLGWTIQLHNQQLTVVSPPWSFFSANWGRQVVILYDRQDILINCTTYGLHDFKSPFHWFGNRNRERQLIEGFEQKIKTTNR